MGTLIADSKRALAEHLASLPAGERNGDEAQEISEAIGVLDQLEAATPQTIVVVVRGGVCDAVYAPKGMSAILVDWDNLGSIGYKPSRAIEAAAEDGRIDALTPDASDDIREGMVTA